MLTWLLHLVRFIRYGAKRTEDGICVTEHRWWFLRSRRATVTTTSCTSSLDTIYHGHRWAWRFALSAVVPPPRLARFLDRWNLHRIRKRERAGERAEARLLAEARKIERKRIADYAASTRRRERELINQQWTKIEPTKCLPKAKVVR